LLANTASRGPAGARNTGIRAATGAAVAFLDSDDCWEPSKLARFMARLDAVPEAVLIASDYRMIDRERGTTTTMKAFLLDTMVPWWQSDPLARAVTCCESLRRDIGTITRPGLFLSLTIAGFPWVHTSSAMVRRDAAMAAGLFDERLERTEDIDLWLKLDRAGRFVYLDEVLASYDITGRDRGSGSRYRLHHPSRRHTGYVEARYHLRLLDRIERSHRLAREQSKLLKQRRISQHRRCAVEALRERHWRGLLHAIPCVASKSERNHLLRDAKDILLRGGATTPSAVDADA